jgi:hypothetical protein
LDGAGLTSRRPVGERQDATAGRLRIGHKNGTGRTITYIPLIQRKPGALRNGAPFADMPEPLQQLRRALLRDPGGDRVMAQVLAIVPRAGLDAVHYQFSAAT